MPLLSYDPALTVASGAELGLLAAVALAPRDEARQTPRMTRSLERTLHRALGQGGRRPHDGRRGAGARRRRRRQARADRRRRDRRSAGPALRARGTRSAPRSTTLAPGIDAVNMTPESALHEYGALVLRSELVDRALFENRAVRGFLGAIPGLDAYAMLGKAWWHTTELVDGRPRYDLVILDGPASGHATLMLRIPQAHPGRHAEGPAGARRPRHRATCSRDPARAALVIVTLAEELPARETVELADRRARRPRRAARAAGRERRPDRRRSAPGGDRGAAPRAADQRRRRGARRHAAPRGQRARPPPGRRRRCCAACARDPGLPIVPLPRIPTAELGPAGSPRSPEASLRGRPRVHLRAA